MRFPGGLEFLNGVSEGLVHIAKEHAGLFLGAIGV